MSLLICCGTVCTMRWKRSILKALDDKAIDSEANTLLECAHFGLYENHFVDIRQGNNEEMPCMY